MRQEFLLVWRRRCKRVLLSDTRIYCLVHTFCAFLPKEEVPILWQWFFSAISKGDGGNKAGLKFRPRETRNWSIRSSSSCRYRRTNSPGGHP